MVLSSLIKYISVLTQTLTILNFNKMVKGINLNLTQRRGRRKNFMSLSLFLNDNFLQTKLSSKFLTHLERISPNLLHILR